MADVIVTCADAPAFEILLFERQVKSRRYYVQMRGRETRVFKEDKLQTVTRDAAHKTHMVWVDLFQAGLNSLSKPLSLAEAHAGQMMSMC